MSITSIEEFNDELNKLCRQMMEEKEKMLIDIITKYDFVVGSADLKAKLTEILPKEANIVYSPLIEDQTTIFAIKKFDVTDLINTYSLIEIEEEE